MFFHLVFAYYLVFILVFCETDFVIIQLEMKWRMAPNFLLVVNFQIHEKEVKWDMEKVFYTYINDLNLCVLHKQTFSWTNFEVYLIFSYTL